MMIQVMKLEMRWSSIVVNAFNQHHMYFIMCIYLYLCSTLPLIVPTHCGHIHVDFESIKSLNTHTRLSVLMLLF